MSLWCKYVPVYYELKKILFFDCMLGAPRNDRGSGAHRKPPPCTPPVTPLSDTIPVRRNAMSLGQGTNNCDIPGSGHLISVMPRVGASDYRNASMRANVCCAVPEGRAASSCDVPEVAREGVGQGKFE